LEGKEVDVSSHPAFTGTLNTISGLFSMLDDPDFCSQLGYFDAVHGKFVHHAFLVPRITTDLSKRAKAFQIWAESTSGIMSRLSDYARSRLTGWSTRERYRKYDTCFADKIASFYEEAKG
jgi:4-hydroxyphenylacetate 3-monooxygenase